ncbi:MAG: hypothetical protein RO257_07485 [Candidatus Kapabacteria bacterium]|jgi:hypothetical protein|nr:hypothetical protein [Candidatus Kapabacteria bacterium]
MNYAQEYKEEKMKDLSFRKAYLEEKTKLDLEFMLDELSDKIKLEKSYSELLKGVKKIKRTLQLA